MTDNRGEVVIYLRSMSPMGAAAWPDPPGTPYVPQSLLLAAREKNLGLTIAAHGLSQELEARKADLVESQRLHEEALFGWNAEKQRAERAEAELAECRRDAERYRWLRANHVRRWEYDVPNDSSAKSLDIDFEAEGHDLDAAIDAAIDACVGGEKS